MRDRIVDFRRVPAGELRPAAANWRTHPDAQRQALASLLERIGVVDAVIARETPDGLELVDGHLRAEVIDTTPVPVLVVDLDDDEAAEALATIDPLAAMAGTNAAALGELLDSLQQRPKINYGHLYQELDMDLEHATETTNIGELINAGRDPQSQEVYTPAEIVDAARRSLGGVIDLDPASSEEANRTVGASKIITAHEDGLSQQWHGSVWCNPPFAAGGLRLFSRHLLAEMKAGRVDRACFLGPAVGGSTWPDEMSAASTGIVHLEQQLPWHGPSKASGSLMTHLVWLLGDCDLTAWEGCPNVAAVTRTQWSRTDPDPEPEP